MNLFIATNYFYEMMINSIIFFQLRRVLILVLFFLLSLLVLTTRLYAQSEKLNKIDILKSLFLNKSENSSVFIQLGHSRGVQSLKVSNSGTSVLSGGEDNTVKLWDSKTGRILVTLDRKYHRPSEVEFLCGDYTKARKQLKWKPKTTFKELLQLMVKSDIDYIKN